MRRIILAILFLLASATLADAQPVKPSMGGSGCSSPTKIVVQPGAFNDLADFAKTGAQCMVNDASSTTDCTVGGGTETPHFCCFDGTAWSTAACGGGTGGGGGSDIGVDLGNNGVDSSAITQITTTGDNAGAAAVFTLPTAGNLKIDLAKKWPVASAADALSANPGACLSNKFVTDIAADGTLSCSFLSDADIPNTITVNLANLANALANEPPPCSTNQFVNDVNADGSLVCAAITDAMVPNDITLSSAASVAWAALNAYPTACNRADEVTAYGDTLTCDHPTHLRVVDNCIGTYGDRLWHDTNCDIVKDAGENFIDHRGVVKKVLPTGGFNGSSTHFDGLLPSVADVSSNDAVEITINATIWIRVNDCDLVTTPWGNFELEFDGQSVDFCDAPDAVGYASAEYTEAE